MDLSKIWMHASILQRWVLIGLLAALAAVPAKAEPSPRAEALVEAIQQARIEPRRIIQEAQRDWSAYNASGNEDLRNDSILRVVTLLERWEADREDANAVDDDPHAGTSAFAVMRDDFFVWERLLSWYHAVHESELVTNALRERVESFVEATIRPMERGPNNRSFHFALAAVRSAELFPEAAAVPTWRRYAEAVWDDWYRLGDTYEPGYVAHHFPQIIELGLALGKTNALRSERAQAAWTRFANHVAPSGRVVQPGDGGERDQEAYERGLLLAAQVTEDAELAWIALANHRLDSRGARSAAALEAVRRQLEESGITSEMPEAFSGVQHLFAKTHPNADRLILNASREPGSPYMAMYLNDRTNTTFHGHEDNRGDIFHYEVDDALLLRREGWSKWVGHANTLVVTDAVDEFPHYLTKGLTPDHWYSARSNLTIVRDYMESDRWEYAPEPTFQGMHAFRERERHELGYSWTNPDALEGQVHTAALNHVIIRWVNFPERAYEVFDSHYLTDLDFVPGMAWYREHRSVAPSTKTFSVTLRDLRISGMQDRRSLWSMNELPGNIELHYYPAGSGRDAEPEVVRGEALADWLNVLDDGSVRLQCPPGRVDLILPTKGDAIDFATDQWIELDYKLDASARTWLRPPLRILPNGLNPRSMYPDRQQGGVLVDAATEADEQDRYGRSHYKSIWTAQSEWRRHTLLTEEGILVVLDEFRPGADALGLAGGPVWHLADAPAQGMHWFSAPAFSTRQQRLMVYFHPQSGNEYASRFLPKLWRTHPGYGVFGRRTFQPGEPAFFLSVLVPHSPQTRPEVLSGRLHIHGGLDSARDPNTGIRTHLSDCGAAEVILSGTDPRLRGNQIHLRLNAAGDWAVERGTGE